MDAEIQWGEIGKDRRTKEVRFLETFQPGWYTDVELILTPAKGEDLKWVVMKLKTDRLAMNVSR